MGQTGADVQLSEAARGLIPYDAETKSYAKFAIYTHFQQATANTGEGRKPLLVVRQNRSEPLAIIRLEDFMELLSKQQT